MTKIRRLGLWILALILVALAGDRVLSLAIERVVLASQLRFSRIYDGAVEADVLVLGNSRGVNGFNAPVLSQATGLRVFNASYNGLSAVLAEAIMRDFLERNPDPWLVVLEVTNVNSRHEALKDLRLYRFASERLRVLDRRFNGRLAAATDVSHLLMFNNQLFFRSAYYLGRSDQNWANGGRINAALLASVDSMQPFRIATAADNVAALRSTIAVAREHGVQVALVVSPYLPAYRTRIANYDEWLASLRADLGDDVQIFDFSSAIADSDLFADRVHLNTRGSREFARHILQAGILARAADGVKPR